MVVIVDTDLHEENDRENWRARLANLVVAVKNYTSIPALSYPVVKTGDDDPPETVSCYPP